MNTEQIIRLAEHIEGISALLKDGPDWKGGIAIGKDLAAIRTAVEAATQTARDLRAAYYRLAELQRAADRHHRAYLDAKTFAEGSAAHDKYLAADAEARSFKLENRL